MISNLQMTITMKLTEVTMSNCIFEPTDYTSSCKRCGKQKFEHTTTLTDKLKKIMNKQTTTEMTLGESRLCFNLALCKTQKL
jgi:hypothetical protein